MPPEIAIRFRSGLAEVRQALLAVNPDLADLPWRANGWTRKQIVCHLLDSAANNRQRFVRAALDGAYTGPGYAQDAWVELQGTPNRAGRRCSAGGRPSTRCSSRSSIAFPPSACRHSASSAEPRP